jgi:hypothetical protein
MTADRELLERAAKAAGIELKWETPEWSNEWCFIPSAKPPHNRRAKDATEGVIWNPLDDDGDALRLASKLRLLVDFSSCCAMNMRSADDDWFGGLPGDDRIGCSPVEFDGPAVVRRAIVRAAAALAPD